MTQGAFHWLNTTVHSRNAALETTRISIMPHTWARHLYVYELEWLCVYTTQGAFQRGIPHGRGVYTWPNGQRFEGHFVDGLYHGHGVYV